jgi:hypothetical protein
MLLFPESTLISGLSISLRTRAILPDIQWNQLVKTGNGYASLLRMTCEQMDTSPVIVWPANTPRQSALLNPTTEFAK